MGWYMYINLFLIVLFCIALVYFLGGVIALLRNERKAMFPIFAVNFLSFVFVLVFTSHFCMVTSLTLVTSSQ